MNMQRILSAAIAGVLALAAAAPLRAAEAKPLLHPLFSDGMVLPRDVPAPVWGWSRPGDEVTVEFAGQKKTAKAGADGKWMARLDPLPASAEPRALTVRSPLAPGPSVVSDVLVGDVWLCSGQSNMQMGLGGVTNAAEEIAHSDLPLLRLFTVPDTVAFEPQALVAARWTHCTPQTSPGFSAAAYFFGRELARELQVPIGLIHSSWGGTIAEAWTSAEALQAMDDFKPAVSQVAATAAAVRSGEQEAMIEKSFRAHDAGTAGEWFKPETDAAGWREGNLPAEFEQSGFHGFDGIVWYQRAFDAPAAWAGKDLVLSLGAIDDMDTTWVNGVKVGSMDRWDAPRVYPVPAALVRAGRNVIAIRVLDTAGGGGLVGRPEQLRVFPAGDEAAALPLAGPWRMKDTATLAQLQPLAVLGNNNPNVCTVLYNGMIAPLVPFALKGAIWYQGESNAGRGYQYRTLLPTMIRDWRARFGVGDFGFYIVSLANFLPVQPEPRENDWAELREAQAMTARALPHCGLAVAIDIGEAADIHPKNKQEVGRRLALAALADTYGRKLECSGPWYRAMESAGAAIRLRFDHVGGGLAAKGGKLTGFAIAGEDRKFVWADAAIDGDAVVVSSPAVAKPVAVRYAWDVNPVCNLCNQQGLPAVPFRTDDWPGITLHNK